MCAILAFVPACLLAPPRPLGGDDGGTGDDGGHACIPTTALLRASLVMAIGDSDYNTLVRAGTWDGQAVVNVYPSGPNFDFRCPKTTIQIGRMVTVHALSPMGDDTVLVLASAPNNDIVVIAVPLDGSAPRSTSDVPLPQGAVVASPFIAYHPMTQQVLFGFEGYVWTTTGALGLVDLLSFAPDPEHFYAAAPLPISFPLAEWAVVGRRANLYMLVDGTAMSLRVIQQKPHGANTCDGNVGNCDKRIAHAPHVSPRDVDDLSAYSIAASTKGDMTLLKDNGSTSAVSTTEVDVSAYLGPATAQDVAMFMRPNNKLAPIVLRDTTPLSLALGPGTSIDVGTTGTDAHVVLGAFTGDGFPRALVLVDAPGKGVESCVVIKDSEMTRCD